MARFSEILVGEMKETGFLLTGEPVLKKKANGGKYVATTISDGEVTCNVNIWDADEKALPILEKGKAFSGKVQKGMYNDSITYGIKYGSMKLLPDAERENYVRKPPRGLQEMWDKITSLISKTGNGGNATLTMTILDENKAKFMRWSAAEKIHHNLYGGLLYHVYRMVLVAYNIQTIVNRRMTATVYDIIKRVEDENIRKTLDECLGLKDALVSRETLLGYYIGKVYNLDTDIILAASLLRSAARAENVAETSPGQAAYSADRMFSQAYGCADEKQMLIRHCIYVSENKAPNIPEGQVILSAEQISAAANRKIDGELLVSATALHDIGKLVELDVDDIGCTEYTVEGALLGHLVLGMNLVQDTAEKMSVDPSGILSCIAGHHGKLEWGALKEPETAEEKILFDVDFLDSRIYIFEEAVKDVEPGKFSDRQFALNGARVYRRH